MDIEKELARELSFSAYIEKVLADNAGKIHDTGIPVFTLKKATAEEDMKNGFDFVFTMGNFTVPVRIRKPDCRYRDFTVRSQSRSFYPTEIHKLRDGAGDVYFYAWTKWIEGQEQIVEWWLINLHEFRKSNLMQTERGQISNGDGTKFVNYKFYELYRTNCIINTFPANKMHQLNLFAGG